jgi:uncharacterized protein (TIGR00251 family)
MPHASRIWCRSEKDESGHRLILTLHVQPGAKRTEAVGLYGDALKIRLAALPVDGAANSALLEFLAEIFDVPQRQVTLKQGLTSRRKIVEIREAARAPDALYKPKSDS